MTTQPLFTTTADGTAYDIQQAGVLLLANTVYGDPVDTPPAGRARAMAMVGAMLAAAQAGGYKQCDILHTLLARNESSARIQLMARDACIAAGDLTIGQIFEAMRTQ